jgi:hypothetical protein
MLALANLLKGVKGLIREGLQEFLDPAGTFRKRYATGSVTRAQNATNSLHELSVSPMRLWLVPTIIFR